VRLLEAALAAHCRSTSCNFAAYARLLAILQHTSAILRSISFVSFNFFNVNSVLCNKFANSSKYPWRKLGVELFIWDFFLGTLEHFFSEKFERVLSSNPAKFEAGTSVTLLQLHQYPVHKK
jgi:hypothetical protein